MTPTPKPTGWKCEHDFSGKYRKSIICVKCGLDKQCLPTEEECEIERLVRELELFATDRHDYLSCEDAGKLAKYIRSNFSISHL